MKAEIKYQTLEHEIEIAYTDNGLKSKPTLLFIHGLASYHGVWNWNIEALSSKFRCIAIDLPGNGASKRGEYPYTMQFYTDVVIDFVKKMRLGTVILAAHSMGGLIAMKVALSREIPVEKLILFAPAGFEAYTPHESMLFKSAIAIGNFLNLDETQISQSIHSSFYHSNPIADKIVRDLTKFIQQSDRKLYRSMLEKSIHSMLDEPLFPMLKEIRQPGLVFFGENDMMIPNRFLHPVSTVELAERAVAEMPDAKLITYKHTGHFVQIEKAEEANKIIVDFLN